MKLRRRIKRYLIPHKGNAYKPKLLRAGGVMITALVIVALFFGALMTGRSIHKGSDFLAAVISAVLIDLANTDRAGSGLPTLSISPTLTAAAEMKANDMAKEGYFAHTSPTGVEPWYWFRAAGYNFLYAGENLAVRFSDSADVERAWMLSPAHRANIMNGHFTEIGIATAEGLYEGKPTVFVVQLFGSPQILSNAQAAPAPKVTQKESVVRIVHADDTFIAVKNAAAPASPEVAGEQKVVEISQTPSFWHKLLASPKTSLGFVYLFVASIICLVMTFMIGIEIRRQHPLHIAYGTGLLLLMVVLLYAYQASFSGPVIVL